MENSTANPHVPAAIDELGGDTAVAKLAGLKTSWAVAKWRQKLPEKRVLWLAQQTGFKFTPHQLDPLMYPNKTDGLPPDFKPEDPDHPAFVDRRTDEERRADDDRREAERRALEERRQNADRRDALESEQVSS